jgi:hypothetical protein
MHSTSKKLSDRLHQPVIIVPARFDIDLESLIAHRL